MCVNYLYAGDTSISMNHNDIDHWNSVLENIVPQNLRNIRVVKEDDIIIYKEYGVNPRNREFIYEDNLAAYKKGKHLSFLRGDFNNNGKEDISLACLNPSERNSYLVILEKENNNYRLANYFQFKARIFFVCGINKNMIDLCFQSGTDWTEQVYWDGRDYVLKEDDPYGP